MSKEPMFPELWFVLFVDSTFLHFFGGEMRWMNMLLIGSWPLAFSSLSLLHGQLGRISWKGGSFGEVTQLMLFCQPSISGCSSNNLQYLKWHKSGAQSYQIAQKLQKRRGRNRGRKIHWVEASFCHCNSGCMVRGYKRSTTYSTARWIHTICDLVIFMRAT